MRKPTHVLIAVASFASACGDGPVDASEVITLVAEDEGMEEQKQTIARAGEAWNLEFGTRLQTDLGDGVSDQSISIWLTGEGCMNERFLRTHARALADPPEIRVCPETALDPLLLFETLRHELGHVLGIERHASSASAVMTALSTELMHWFEVEDRELFFSANPTFQAHPR